MTRPRRYRFPLAILLGAAIAFPLGVMIGQGGKEDRTGRSPGGTSSSRAIYSPKIIDDPYVLEQQRKTVEALELECRQYGSRCAEAGAARRYLLERER